MTSVTKQVALEAVRASITSLTGKTDIPAEAQLRADLELDSLDIIEIELGIEEQLSQQGYGDLDLNGCLEVNELTVDEAADFVVDAVTTAQVAA